MKFSFGKAFALTFAFFKKVFMHFTLFSMIIATLTLLSNSFHPYVGLLFQFTVWPLLLAGYYLYLAESQRPSSPPFAIFFQGVNYFLPIVYINATKLIFSSLLFFPYTATYSELLQEFMETRNADLQKSVMASLSSPEFFIGTGGSFLLFYFTSLAVPYVLFSNKTPINAILKSARTNFKIIQKGLIYYFLLILLSGTGFLFFGVGIFLTAGIYFCGIFALYSILHTNRQEPVITDIQEQETRIE